MHFYIYIVEIFPGKFIISCMHRKIFHYMKNFLDEIFPSIHCSAVQCRAVQGSAAVHCCGMEWNGLMRTGTEEVSQRESGLLSNSAGQSMQCTDQLCIALH